MIRLGLGLTDRVRYWIERKRKKKKVGKGGGTEQKEQGQSYLHISFFDFFRELEIVNSRVSGEPAGSVDEDYSVGEGDD